MEVSREEQERDNSFNPLVKWNNNQRVQRHKREKPLKEKEIWYCKAKFGASRTAKALEGKQELCSHRVLQKAKREPFVYYVICSYDQDCPHQTIVPKKIRLLPPPKRLYKKPIHRTKRHCEDCGIPMRYDGRRKRERELLLCRDCRMKRNGKARRGKTR